MTSKLPETIVWDWNGTLLNDTNHCIRCMNRLLKRRSLPHLCIERYRSVFTFPVRKYYQELGFDLEMEPFEIPAEEFIVEYNIDFEKVPLFDDSASVLEFFQRQGVKQYILSAMQHDALVESVEERGIAQFFNGIYGIADNLAHGKTAIAHRLISDGVINPEKAILIGDTLHDAEVAREMQMNETILIARGHQSEERLVKTGNPVFHSLTEMVDSLK